MMKRLSLLAVTAILWASPATAQEDLLEYVVSACEADLVQFCSTVNPGEGRLLHCVAAHEDQLSGQCAYALYQAATLLDQLAAAIGYFAESCATDIKAHCSDVAPGEGRVVACLSGKSEELSATCSQAMQDTVGE
jgi:Golgi apparatus protein 1